MTRPRSVLLVHEIPSGPGGAERYLERLASGLRARGVEVHGLIFGVDARAGRLASERLARSGADVTHVAGHFRPGAMTRALRRTRADLIHWNFSGPFAYRGGSWLLAPWGRPSVVTEHLPMLEAKWYYELARRAANERINAMILVSESSLDAAREHWARLPPHHVILNGVELRPPRAARPAVDRPVSLLVLGRLVPQKNPAFAIDVLASARERGVNGELIFIGDGELLAEVQEHARATGMSDHVAFPGWVDDPSGDIDRAHVLLLPSRYESGPPLAPMEALAAGVPVLASDIPAHAEFPDDGGAVERLPLDDASAWGEAVAGIAAWFPERSATAQAASTAFSIDVSVDKTLAVYRGVLSL